MGGSGLSDATATSPTATATPLVANDSNSVESLSGSYSPQPPFSPNIPRVDSKLPLEDIRLPSPSSTKHPLSPLDSKQLSLRQQEQLEQEQEQLEQEQEQLLQEQEQQLQEQQLQEQQLQLPLHKQQLPLLKLHEQQLPLLKLHDDLLQLDFPPQSTMTVIPSTEDPRGAPAGPPLLSPTTKHEGDIEDDGTAMLNSHQCLPVFDNPCHQPLRYHALTWAVAAQEGYRILDPTLRSRAKLHDDIEDVHFPQPIDQPAPFIPDPVTRDFPRLSASSMAKNGAKVFIVADGHGGGEAPRFFVGRLAHDIILLLDSRFWDLSLTDHRTLLSSEITALFKLLDVEYQSIKVAQYRAWLDAGSPHSIRKPRDDGCTMIANIVMDQWIVNCNVGDSRTVIGAKLPWPPAVGLSSKAIGSSHQQQQKQKQQTKSPNSSNWIQLYASEDHNMMHPQKVASIHANGGKFLDPQGASFLSIDIQPPNIRNKKPYLELNGARIFRPMSPSVSAVGCSHRRTLNLTATLGDLLFKIEPAILSSAPDIRFIKLEPGMDYVVVAATDGLWDHLTVQYPPDVQNDRILSFVTRTLQNLLPVTAPGVSVSAPGDPSASSNAFDGNHMESSDASSMQMSHEPPPPPSSSTTTASAGIDTLDSHHASHMTRSDQILSPTPVHAHGNVDIDSTLSTASHSTFMTDTDTDNNQRDALESNMRESNRERDDVSLSISDTPVDGTGNVSDIDTENKRDDQDSATGLSVADADAAATAAASAASAATLASSNVNNTAASTLLSHQLDVFERISYCAEILVHREPHISGLPDENLFVPNLIRYDDATTMVLYFSYVADLSEQVDVDGCGDASYPSR